MERIINLSDKELYCVALAIETHINARETYWTTKSANNFNRMVKKIIEEGMKRKDPKSILHPILNFNEDEN